MSANASNDIYAPTQKGPRAPRAAILEMMNERFQHLPDIDRKLFNYGPLYLGGNGAFAGLIANSLYRRALNVTQGRIASSLPMAVLPFLTTVALYDATLAKPLLLGDLDCPTCALTRGALVGALGAGLYPILLALPVNAGLAAKYQTAPMPEKGNVVRFWINITRPILRKMWAVFILQAFFGTYLSSKHFETYLKLLQLAQSNDEEFVD